jgi:serine/threonine protein kinase
MLMEEEGIPECPTCGVARTASSASLASDGELISRVTDLPGAWSGKIDDYEILSEIARGGMGIVYRARQLRLNRIVALKVMLPGIVAGPAQVQRFKAEAQIAATLNHPNIISIFEVGEENGAYFFSMPLVKGKDLAKIGRVDAPKAARYAEKIAQAVYHAHQRGVLHRDLKPNNILVDERDEPHIVDFGIAKLTDGTRMLTQTGESLGTPSYMAPEQVHPDGNSLSVAADIYAVGGILYFLLTGRAPFTGGSRDQILWSVFYDEPERPAALNPGVPRDLETICLKCLAKDPAQRYATAGQLAEDLRRYQNKEPINARPVSGWQRAGMWARRNPALAISIAALIAALSYGIIAQQLALRQARKARADAENLIEFMDKELTDKLRPLGRLDLTGEVIRKAEAYFREQDENNSEPSFLIRKASFFCRAGKLERELGRLPEAQQFAGKGLETLDRLEKRNGSDAEEWSLRADLELLLHRVARTLGNKAEARQYSSRALEHQRQAQALSPADTKAAAKTSEVLLEVEEFLRTEGDTEAAEALLSEACEKLALLARDNRDDLQIQRLLAASHYHKGQALEHMDDNAAALAEYKLFTKALEDIAHSAADDRDWQFELAIAYGRAASAHYALRDTEVSEALIAKWRNAAENLAAFDPNNVHWRASLAQSLAWSAMVMRNKDQSDKRIPQFFTRALEIYDQLSKQNPNEDQYFDRIDELGAELNLYFKTNDLLKQAEDACQANLDRQLETAARFPWRLAQQRRLLRAFAKWVSFLDEQGRSDEAAKLCLDWIGRLPARFASAPSPHLWRWPHAYLHELLANLKTRQGLFDESAAQWREAIDLLKGLTSRPAALETAEDLVYAFSSLVSVHQKRGDSASLVRVANEGMDWLEGSPARTTRLMSELYGVVFEKARDLENSTPEIEQLMARCRQLSEREADQLVSGDEKGSSIVQSSGNAASQ